MRENYLTVKGYGESEIVISKSRFLTYIERAETEEDAISFIDRIKKMHHNATHNCSAYIIGEHDNIQKANDDGEPSGTAGVPMLEVLKKQGLKDTVVVVTRYFGEGLNSAVAVLYVHTEKQQQKVLLLRK